MNRFHQIVLVSQDLILENEFAQELPLISPSEIDFSETLKHSNKHNETALEILWIEKAIGKVLGTTPSGLSDYESYLYLAMCSDVSEIDFVEQGVCIVSSYDNMGNATVDDAISVIDDLTEEYASVARYVFEHYHAAEVAKAIDCSLDGDSNNRSLDSFFGYGINIGKTFKYGDNVLNFDVNACKQWVGVTGDSYSACPDTGLPMIERNENSDNYDTELLDVVEAVMPTIETPVLEDKAAKVRAWRQEEAEHDNI
tara:strand:+ start:1316 stop:2080 length:765 start_codon:yes stop_codon:yes gene_type:complete